MKILARNVDGKTMLLRNGPILAPLMNPYDTGLIDFEAGHTHICVDGEDAVEEKVKLPFDYLIPGLFYIKTKPTIDGSYNDQLHAIAAYLEKGDFSMTLNHGVNHKLRTRIWEHFVYIEDVLSCEHFCFALMLPNATYREFIRGDRGNVNKAGLRPGVKIIARDEELLQQALMYLVNHMDSAGRRLLYAEDPSKGPYRQYSSRLAIIHIRTIEVPLLCFNQN